MHRHGGEWKRLRAAADDLVAERQRAQHLQGVGAGRLGFGQQRGQNVGARMRGSETIALIELAPGRGGAVRGGGRIAIGARRRVRLNTVASRAVERSVSLACAACTSGSASAATSRGDVVGQHQRRAPQHRIRNLRRLSRRLPRRSESRVAAAASARGDVSTACRTQNHFHKSVFPLSSCAEP